MSTLARLRRGDVAVVTEVHASDELYLRLAALGFRVGKRVELLRRAAFAGPLHVRLGTTDVILRRREAERVRVAVAHPSPRG